MDDGFAFEIERFSHFRGRLLIEGWAFHRERRVVKVQVRLPDGQLVGTIGYGLASSDVESIHGEPATSCRFSLEVPVEDPNVARDAALVFGLAKRHTVIVENLTGKLAIDPFHRLFGKFVESVRAFDSPTILEVGSRARSGNVNTGWIPEGARYSGFDFAEGPNVDVVGDAHELGSFFAAESIDFIFSISTFEHLAMPWKVCLEMNKVMRPGALAYLGSHQTWPLHEEPWDYWRFSSHTWPTIFNEATGFEVVEAAMGERASVVAEILHPPTAGLDAQPAFLGSSAIVRKIGSSALSWNVELSRVVEGRYPA